jgi:hypothetical protein
MGHSFLPPGSVLPHLKGIKFTSGPTSSQNPIANRPLDEELLPTRLPGHGQCMKVTVFIYLQTSIIRWQCHVMYVVPSALPCSDFVIAISRPYDTQLVLMDTQIRSLHLSRLPHLPSRENIPWLVLFGPSTKKTFSPLKPEPSCHAAWFCLSHLPRDPVPIILESLSSFRCRIHQGNAEGAFDGRTFWAAFPQNYEGHGTHVTYHRDSSGKM